jgi:hypothetical protein
MVCRVLIDPERVAEYPETVLCNEHAEQIEKFGGEFKRSVTQERLSKAQSLKRNYGAVETRKYRNHLAMQKLCREFDEQRNARLRAVADTN